MVQWSVEHERWLSFPCEHAQVATTVIAETHDSKSLAEHPELGVAFFDVCTWAIKWPQCSTLT